jgi:hypothetical protein
MTLLVSQHTPHSQVARVGLGPIDDRDEAVGPIDAADTRGDGPDGIREHNPPNAGIAREGT